MGSPETALPKTLEHLGDAGPMCRLGRALGQSSALIGHNWLRRIQVGQSRWSTTTTLLLLDKADQCPCNIVNLYPRHEIWNLGRQWVNR